LRAGVLNGWPLLGLVSALLAAGALGMLAGGGEAAEGSRRVIRATARSSLLLFCLAFTASALFRLVPNVWTAWQRRNRRQLGLAFAVSHGIHALALAALALTAPILFAEMTGTGTLVLGGVGYLFILAMAATSFDRSAAAIGPRAWKRLHTIGGWFLWFSFAVIYARRLALDIDYWPAAAILLGVLALRTGAAMARQGGPQAGPGVAPPHDTA